MSEYQEFLQERDRIDFLIQQGYRINHITENLSGAFVNFEKVEESGETQSETLQIVTPDARKYFSVLLIKQQKDRA